LKESRSKALEEEAIPGLVAFGRLAALATASLVCLHASVDTDYGSSAFGLDLARNRHLSLSIPTPYAERPVD